MTANDLRLLILTVNIAIWVFVFRALFPAPAPKPQAEVAIAKTTDRVPTTVLSPAKPGDPVLLCSDGKLVWADPGPVCHLGDQQ